MRTTSLLLVGVSIFFAIAGATSSKSIPSISTDAKANSDKSTVVWKKSTGKTDKITTNATKTTDTVDSEKRDKRTLYEFARGENFYNDLTRRQDYANQARFYSHHDNLYNGDQLNSFSQGGSSNHLPSTDFGSPYGTYPQYLQSPEPIIEIIIKDSNETSPAVQSKPVVIKKKKEKVHVYYVKYKKDENNKLHLESPIASLNNDENEEEEEEEIIHIPAIVTPIPPLKTTTLRTIIHPESEKYHSNSGIHVTFGSEDKSQTGHVIEEHNEGSELRQVVALPVQQTLVHQQANVRADFEGSNARSQSNYNGINFYQQLPSTQGSGQNFNYNYQELPATQAAHVFRSPQQHTQQKQDQQYFSQPHLHQHHQQQRQQEQQQQQYQYYQQTQFQPEKQRQSYNIQSQPSYRGPQQPSIASKVQPQKQPLRPQYNQQSYPQQPFHYQLFNQYFHQYKANAPSDFTQPSRAPNQSQIQKQPHFFPTPLPSKQQDSKHQKNLATTYQPVKFRPTIPSHTTKSVLFPVKLENTNYYQQHSNNKHHQQPSTQELQQFSHNRQHFGSSPPLHSSQYPSTFHSPIAPQEIDYYNTKFQSQTLIQQQQKEQKYQKNQSQLNNNKYQTQALGSISSLQNYFGTKTPSKETELFRAIPRFEQHITETVNHRNPSEQQEIHGTYQHYPYSSKNQAIHDIPAPKLGPTPASAHDQSATKFPYSPHNVGNIGTSSEKSNNFNYYTSPTLSPQAPQYAETDDGQKVQIVTPMPSNNFYNQNYAHSSQYTSHGSQPQVIHNSQPFDFGPQNIQQPRNKQIAPIENQDYSSDFSVSTLHSDVFRDLNQRKNLESYQSTERTHDKQKSESQFLQNQYSVSHLTNFHATPSTSTTLAPPLSTTTAQSLSSSSQSSPTTNYSSNASKNSLQLPDEVPDDLRNQLLSSGILENADISILDYDKVGDVALENLPAEHLQHFYGAGGAAQISGSNKVLAIVKTNGESVNLSQNNIKKNKEIKTLPQRKEVDVKVVRFDSNNETNVASKFLRTHSTVVPPVDLNDRQYNRYLPLKINGAQFPIPDVDELRHKKIVSVVVLAPVDTMQSISDEISEVGLDSRPEREATPESKEVKFIGGDTIKQLLRKPSKENFKHWLEREAQADIEMQSVVLLVTKTPNNDEQEIYMYEIATGVVNKLNGDLSSAFVNVAEENASSEDLEHASTLDPGFLENMINKMNEREKV